MSAMRCFPAINLISLVTPKDRGGLVYPSTDIVKILSIAERIFKSFVVGAVIRVFHPASSYL